MSSPIKTVLVPDFKTEEGLWAKEPQKDCVRYKTLACRTWHAMLDRCREGGYLQTKSPWYVGCTADETFMDYQLFADWCQVQVGYGRRGFALDKDIVKPGNKIYGVEFCVFVPRLINNFYVKPNTPRALPTGVFELADGFQAASGVEGEQIKLGTFASADEAAMAYKTRKEAYAKRLAEKFRNDVDKRVYDVLVNFKVGEN